jgi:G3E family GTPase
MAHHIPTCLVTGFYAADVSAVLEHLAARGPVHILDLDPLLQAPSDTDAPDADVNLALAGAVGACTKTGAQLVVRSSGTDLAGLIDLLMSADTSASSTVGASSIVAGHAISPTAAADTDSASVFGPQLGTVLVTVNAPTFLCDCTAAEFLHERNLSPDPLDDRTVADVLLAQIEAATVLVLCDGDRLTQTERQTVSALLRALNPRAALVDTVRSLASDDILSGAAPYDADAVEGGAGWAALLRGSAVPSSADVSGFAYCRRRPFHPQRFFDLMHTDWLSRHGAVLRSRGYFWLASRLDISGHWEQAGGACRHGAAGLWWSATDATDWPEDQTLRAEIALRLQDGEATAPYGDRMQELAFIGSDLDSAALIARLDECLLTDAEMSGGPEAWSALPDPFPEWEADDHDHEHDHEHIDDATGIPPDHSAHHHHAHNCDGGCDHTH